VVIMIDVDNLKQINDASATPPVTSPSAPWPTPCAPASAPTTSSSAGRRRVPGHRSRLNLDLVERRLATSAPASL